MKRTASAVWKGGLKDGNARRRQVSNPVVALMLLSLLPIGTSALESDEFHLFGRSPKGALIDITPFGGEASSEGDPGEGNGLVGQFYVWDPPDGDHPKPIAVGTCRLRTSKKFTFI